MSRPIWFVRILKHYFPDRFRIAGWTKKYPLVRRLIDDLLFGGDEIYYLPKDTLVLNPPQPKTVKGKEDESRGDQGVQANKEVVVIGEAIDRVDNIALPSDAVGHFVEQASHRWIMNECICRSSAHCEDYPVGLGCVFLGDPVQQINPKLGRMASKEEALNHLQRARDVGLVHMVGRNKLDTQWMGVGPGDRLFTICNCCPCCCLYKVIPNLDRSISSKISKMPGVNIVVDAEQCIGCGKCTRPNVCFINAINLVNKKAIINELCVGCGRCVEVCPTGAIEFTYQPEQSVQSTIERLSKKIDVR